MRADAFPGVLGCNTHSRCNAHRVRSALWCFFAAALLCMSHIPVSAQEYRLDTGDKIRIQVPEWPALDGQFRIGAEGILTLPVVGSLNVRGISAPDLSREITQRLGSSTESASAATAVVEIVEHRPFYILGEVQKPGEYESQPNLTVLKAISKANGYFRRDRDLLQRFERDAITARGELSLAEAKVTRLEIKVARLTSQLAGRDQVVLPPRLKTHADDPSVRQLLRQEQDILFSAREALDQKLKAHAGAKAISEEEVRSLQLQMASESKQLEFVRKETEKIRALGERGLAQGSRILDLERNLAQITGSRQALETQVVRARQQMHLAEQRALEERNAADIQTRTDLQIATEALTEAQEQVRMHGQLYAEAETGGPRAAASEAARTIEYRITIVRNEDGTEKELSATGSTEVRPGDVVKVDRIVPTGPRTSRAISERTN